MTGNAWIGVGVVTGAFSLFALPYGFHVKGQESAKAVKPNQGDLDGGDKVDTKGGDYVKGDKKVAGRDFIEKQYVQNGISKSDLNSIKETIKREIYLYLSSHKDLSSPGITAIGVTDKSIIVPPGGDTSKWADFDWSACRIIQEDINQITFVMPTIVTRVKNCEGNTFMGSTVSMPKKVGAQMGIISMPGCEIRAEVVKHENGVWVIVFGAFKS